jgi:hypothetical protein
MRHASTADTILTTALLDPLGLDFRHVMKRAAWDLHRRDRQPPAFFVDRDSTDSARSQRCAGWPRTCRRATAC